MAESLFDDGVSLSDRAPVVRCDNLWRKAEDMVEFACKLGGYYVQRQRKFGRRHGGGYVLDVMCWKSGCKAVAVSVKWQRTPGSWDEKVPGEVRTLSVNVAADKDIRHGYVVLLGPGWGKAKRERWCAGTIDERGVSVIDFDRFMALAFAGEL